MSKYANRSMLSLLNMTTEMYKKKIEIRRIIKTCTLLLMSGLTKYDINQEIINSCLKSQFNDGGFIGNTDTIWNIKFLSFFPEYIKEKERALKWLINNNGDEPGFGRSKRDIHRIPVTGLALYLLPEIATSDILSWLEMTWNSERNSLTYKAAYTILAFINCHYITKNKQLINDSTAWLMSQQELSGGFGPWLNHPVGANVYCTAIALLALISINDKKYDYCIERGYDYLCNTQLKSGIWPYHEIEDGSAWGLLALSETEKHLRI